MSKDPVITYGSGIFCYFSMQEHLIRLLIRVSFFGCIMMMIYYLKGLYPENGNPKFENGNSFMHSLTFGNMGFSKSVCINAIVLDSSH